MACFLVPVAEAVAVTAAFAVAKKREQKIQAPQLANGNKFEQENKKIAWSKKLGWLASLLWGGALLLAFEHIWHGEITPFAPFLTAMSSPEGTAQMLYEMATVGILMAVNVTGVWGVICAVADAKFKKVKASLAANNA